MKKSLLIELISALLILLFLYTALNKIAAHNTFKAALTVSPVVGNKSAFLAWMIPTVELMVSGLLILPQYRIAGLVGSLFLLLVFTFYLVYIVVFHSSHLPCTCGGVISKMSWKQHVFFNLFFIGISMTGIVAAIHSKILLQQYRVRAQPV